MLRLLDTSSPSNFYFNIDQAWTEIMHVFNWFKQFSFSFTTYDIRWTGVTTFEVVKNVHLFKLMDFLLAFLVFTTVDNIVFWWNRRGEFDPFDGDF